MADCVWMIIHYEVQPTKFLTHRPMVCAQTRGKFRIQTISQSKPENWYEYPRGK